jgi:hypothetical protein
MNNKNINNKINNLNKRLNQLQASSSKKSKPRNSTARAPVANAAISSSKTQKNVNVHRVLQTERIGTLVANGSSDYSIVSQSVNPGTTFPWLANQAKMYDKYKFRKLRIHFKTSGPTVNFGTVGLGFDYNPLSGDPMDSVEFSQLTTWNIQSAWKNFTMSVDVTRPLLPYFFTRTTRIGGSDLKTYDIGRLYIMFEGIPTSVTSGTILGYIEAEYDIDLIDKQPALRSAPLSTGLLSYSNYGIKNTSTTGSATTIYCTIQPQIWTVNNLDLPVYSGNSNGISNTFNGTYSPSLPLEPGLYNIHIKTNHVQVPSSIELVDQAGNVLLTGSASTGEILGTILIDSTISSIQVKKTFSSATSTTAAGSGVQSAVIQLL